MAYIYLLNLYEEIEKRFQQLDSQLTEENEKVLYTQGQLDILKEFKQYLADNMSDKLPKRIRKCLSDQK